MKKIILLGGGGHCRSCIDVIEQQGVFCIEGIVDKKEKIRQYVLGYPIIASDEGLPELVNHYDYFLVTIGQILTPKLRIRLYSVLKESGVMIPTIISPLAYVSPHAIIGEGTIIMHHALVNAGANIGNNCIINSKVLVEHDVQVDDNSHIATGVILNGGVSVGEGSFIGSGTVCRENIYVENRSVISCNSTIKK